MRGFKRASRLLLASAFVVALVLVAGLFGRGRPGTLPQGVADQTAFVTTREAPTSGAPAISDEEATALMFTLLRGNRAEARAAVERILAAEDRRFASVFIELLRGSQLSLVRNLDLAEYGQALEKLSGQPLGVDWPAWVEWYGYTDLAPPPGFTGWKGQMLALLDPRFTEFLRDEHPAAIRSEEIVWGGVVVDGIPALDNPPMLAAEMAAYLEPEDVVFGVVLNGDARAYPLRILDWHEMANDIVGGVPVSLAYCTLCGAAIAYDGRASDGNTYDFGSSGFLFRSNKLMYDRQTRTLWNQLTGEPVLGELVGQDIRLDLLPVVLTTWAEWRAQHPDTKVADIDTGFSRNYTPGAPYGDYFAAAETMFPVAQRDDRLAAKTQVYALNIGNQPKAYPIELLVRESVVNDTLGPTGVVLVTRGGIVTVTGESQRAGRVNYSAGSEVRAYERGSLTFASGPDSTTVVDEDGRVWQVTEEALIGPTGETLPRLPGHLAYWFGWYAFYPHTLIYTPSD